MSWQLAVENSVTGLQYQLVDLERSAGGLLRVFIDRIPGHAYAGSDAEFVTVEDCERVTRQLQYVLEVENLAYQRLEVSSPGLDRPLKRVEDYQRFLGLDVNITLKVAFGGRKNYRGQLCVRDDGQEGWRLVLQDSDQALDFTLDEVREARLVPVVDFKGRKASKPAEAGQELDGGQTR